MTIHKMKTEKISRWLVQTCFLSVLASQAYAGTPPFSIKAIVPPPSTIPSNQTVTGIIYQVTNNTPTTRKLALQPVPGITQVTTSSPTDCANNPVAPHASCTITLSINGSLLPAAGVHEGPVVCVAGCDHCLCSKPCSPDNINITVIPPVTLTPVFAYIIGGVEGAVITKCTIDPASPTGDFLPGSCAVQVVGTLPTAFGIVINPAGTFAYLANSSGSTIQCNAAPTTGTLSGCVNTGPGFNATYGIAINTAGTIIYETNFGGPSLNQCAVSAIDGSLTCSAFTSPSITVPFQITLNSANTFAYVTNPSSATVAQCTITAGNLVSCSDSGAGAIFIESADIALNPSNTFAYISNPNLNTVTQCAVNGVTGNLSGCTTLTDPTFSNPYGLTFNANGTQVYLTGNSNNLMTICNVNPVTGAFSACFQSANTDGTLNVPNNITLH